MIDCNWKELTCPDCGQLAQRHSVVVRTVHHLEGGKYQKLQFSVSKHRCMDGVCQRNFFTAPILQVSVKPRHRYSDRFKQEALRLIENMVLEEVVREFRILYGVRLSLSTLHDWTNDERAKPSHSRV